MNRIRHIALGFLVAAWLMVGCFRPVVAQEYQFGSMDDPAEQSNLTWWQSYTDLFLSGGFSLIGPQWRTAGRLDAAFRRPRASLLLSGTFHAGVYGAYEEDTDETYDLLRLISHARYRRPDDRVYLRAGPLERTRLGVGHLVNFLSTETAWDERTVGFEASGKMGYFGLQGFLDDIVDPQLIGGRLALAPFGGSRSRISSSFSVGTTWVADRSVMTPEGHRFEGQAIDITMEAFRSGGFSFHPFLSGARISDFGQGLYVGADIANDNFIDLARLRFRLGVHYGSHGFLPGYFGPFYQVSSLKSSILSSDKGNQSLPTGTKLSNAERGNAVVTEFRILIFERFELWYQFVRHFGVEAQSEYHLRMFLGGEQFQVSVGQDRGGLKNFFSLFNSLERENRMRFEFMYRVVGHLWISAEARYTYERVHPTLDIREQYIAQRRFNPLMGLRIRF